MLFLRCRKGPIGTGNHDMSRMRAMAQYGARIVDARVVDVIDAPLVGKKQILIAMLPKDLMAAVEHA